jgi:ATP-dependent Lhr-like helicase
LQAAATDNGITIALAEQHSFPLADVFNFLHTATAREVLEQAALASPIFGTRWRWDAGRALALLRFRGGKKVPIHILRLQSDDLLASVFPDVAACQENVEGDIKIPDHPLVREVMKDVLTEAMDLDGFLATLDGIADGRIRCVAVDTPVPSAFSHEILNANPYAFLDDAPLEERRARAVEMRRVLPDSVLSEVGRLDPAAIDEVRRDAWPDVRDADDLHDVLQSLVAIPVASTESSIDAWTPMFDELARTRRAGRATSGGRTYWVAADRVRSFLAIFPDARFEAELPPIDTSSPTREVAVAGMVTGWLAHVGPTTAAALAGRVGIPEPDIELALLQIEAAGAVLRGHFTPTPFKLRTSNFELPLEWCDRRLLARIHRLTLGALRREIAPVTAAEFMRWLFAWQHVATGTHLTGERGTLEALEQLQGFEAPANSWERDILMRRVAQYDPDALDRLCLSGAVGWGRLSPHPALAEPTARRVMPTSVAPITFFVREHAEWMAPRRVTDEGRTSGLSPNSRAVADLLQRAGASFFPDLVRGTGQLKAEVETALWELVSAGLVTADGFDNLRALIDPKRRAGQGSGKQSRPRHSSGRWALLYPVVSPDASRIDATCWMLLRRYGVVFRELLARESILPPWRELLIAFRRLEARGEIRGGRFVSGFIGEQYAMPVAVESLRAMRHRASSGDLVTLSAADPLNLVGIIVPGDRVAAISGRFVTFKDGVPIASEPTRIAAS